jgi:exopolysaccharide production protein ExoF
MRRPGRAIASGIVYFCLAASRLSAAEVYLLGPGDHVQVMVSDFRAGTGEAYQWTIYSTGQPEFIVGPDGRLSLPVLGQIDAAGKTTAELEAAISAKLQSKAGLTSRPDASVAIVKFRPFYVIGAVDKPGEYDYRPGLTVLQAVGIGGGLERVTTDELIGFEKDALTSRGDLRALIADRISLMARQARIDAEVGDKAQIAFPSELKAKSADPDVARAMREEQLLFETQGPGLTAQVVALEQNKAYLRNEITELQQKNLTIGTQLVAMQKEYNLIAGLVSKGLATTPRQLELEQNLAEIQNSLLDVQVAIVRANEDISRSDRDILDLKTKFRNDTLVEAADVRAKLADTNEKIQTSIALIQQAEVRAPGMLQRNYNAYDKALYVISRRGADGKAANIPSQESDLVQPGDVVRVIPRALDGTETLGAAAASADVAN